MTDREKVARIRFLLECFHKGDAIEAIESELLALVSQGKQECERCEDLLAHFELVDEFSEVAHPYLRDPRHGFCLFCGNHAAHPWHEEAPTLKGLREIESYLDTMGFRVVRKDALVSQGEPVANNGWIDRSDWDHAQKRSAEGLGADIVVTIDKRYDDDIPVWIGTLPEPSREREAISEALQTYDDGGSPHTCIGHLRAILSGGNEE